jgi:hypothetical protein
MYAFVRWIDVILWKKDFWCQSTRSWGQLFNHNDKTNIVVHFWSIMASDDVQLCQQDLEMPIPLLASNLIWPWVVVRKYKTGTIVAGFWPRVEYQRYRALPLLSNGYSRALIWSMVQKICFIVVDECCWNCALDRLEGTDYFEFLTKIWYENSRNFEYKAHRHLPQIFIKYLCTLLR